jgi:hypothetical protein
MLAAHDGEVVAVAGDGVSPVGQRLGWVVGELFEERSGGRVGASSCSAGLVGGAGSELVEGVGDEPGGPGEVSVVDSVGCDECEGGERRSWPLGIAGSESVHGAAVGECQQGVEVVEAELIVKLSECVGG